MKKVAVNTAAKVKEVGKEDKGKEAAESMSCFYLMSELTLFLKNIDFCGENKLI